jgi:uncharacterized protein (DUF697 family)/tellurite resistance protein
MDQERQSILTIAIMAALADGKQDEAERRAMTQLGAQTTDDYAQAMRAVLEGKVNLADTAKGITSADGKKLAFEIAAAVCNADGASNDAEAKFLDALRASLQLGAAETAMRKDAEAMANLPVSAGAAVSGPSDVELDKTILNYSILNGALELMPETLSTMAIIPLQMKMVYKIGKAHGFDLGREHIRDFIATLGVGLTSQYLEGFARKILGGVLGAIGGGLIGGAGKQVVSSGMSFVTTYALGQAAKRYYAGGRNFEAVKLKELYQSLLNDAKTLSTKYGDEMKQKAAELKSGDIMKLVKDA